LLLSDGNGILPAALARSAGPQRPLRVALLLIAIAGVLRVAAAGALPLIPEEAYYWMYAKHLQLSYYDHPPMVAWVIGLGTLLFGDTELGVRVGACVLMVGTSLLLYRAARLWFPRAAAAAAAVLVQVLPIYFGMGLVAPMDAALCFFWVACLLGVSHAVKTGRARWWYPAGAALGGALLSKYSAIFLAAGVFVAVAGHPRWRRQLATPHPYLALALAALVFSPVVVWNARHDWASFRFQFVERYANDHFNLVTPLQFVFVLFAVATPVPLAAIAFAAPRAVRRLRPAPAAGAAGGDGRGDGDGGTMGPRRRGSDALWFAFACAAPGLAAAAWTSLRSDVHINWTAPMFLTLLPAACATAFAHDRLLARTRRTSHRWWPGMVTTATAVSAASIALLLFLMVLQPRLGVWSAFGPWHELAAVVEEQEDRLEEQAGQAPGIVADGKYRLASVLAFYRFPIEADPVEAIRYTTSQWVLGDEGLAYEFWSSHADWVGRNVIFVTDDPDSLGKVVPWFESVQAVEDPRLEGRRRYHVLVCRNMRREPTPAPAGDT